MDMLINDESYNYQEGTSALRCNLIHYLDENDEGDNYIRTIIIINNCIAQGWLVPVQETDQ